MFIDRFFRFIPKSGLKKALGYFNKGDYKKACREFESYVLKRDVELQGQDQDMIRMYMVESYVEYSKELSSNNKLEESAEQLERAVKLEPRYADVHFALAKIYDKLGKSAESRKNLLDSLEINPNYFRARIMLAKNYHRDEKYENAVEELQMGLSAAPTFYIEQVKELVDLIRTDSMIEKRDDIFHRLLKERPSSSQVSKQISLEAIQDGDYDFALAELKKALSMNPNYPDLHNLLGIAYANKGMTDDALMEFETALKIHPNYLKARLNMALTYYEKGSKEESMKHLNMVLDLDPENELAKNLLQELQPVTNQG